MAKEIIRTLGQLLTSAGDDLIVYSVPEGHSAVISSIIITNSDIVLPSIINVYVKKRGITKSNGRNTSVVAGKLINSNAKFLSTVVINDNVQSQAGGFATVDSVDSDTQLTISNDIFTVEGDDYIVWPPSPGVLSHEIIKWKYSLGASLTISMKEGITLSEFGQIFINTSESGVAVNCFGVETTANK